MRRFWKVLSVALASALIFGCSGGDGSVSPKLDSYVLPAGSAVLSFAAYSTARMPAPITGIDLTVLLPAGLSVPVAGGGASGSVTSASLTPGPLLPGTNLAFGSYSASTRKAHLSVLVNTDSYRSGEFLRLTINVASGSNVTVGDVKALNAPVSVIKATGVNVATQSSVDLTGFLKVLLSVP